MHVLSGEVVVYNYSRMNKFNIPKKKLLLMAVYGAVFIWTGWFLWRDMAPNQREEVSSEANNQPEISEDVDSANDPPPSFGQVTGIVDSLTIVVNDKHKVRYLGVVTPAASDKVECFGKEAGQANESMLGKTVRLEDDPILARARDGAWVRYVWVADDEETQEAYTRALNGETVLGLTEPIIEDNENDSSTTSGDDLPTTPEPNNTADDNKASDDGITEANEDLPAEQAEENNSNEGIALEADTEESEQGAQEDEVKFKEYMVSERIIEMGLGFPLLSQEMRYYDRLVGAARYSSSTKRGLWGACEVSQNEGGLLQTQTIQECTIKGTQTVVSGEKIYRTRDCAGYKDTLVLLYQGGQWFCSEEEAVNGGFVKAIDCGE
jgi:endonuclease YncB( thermonuclease family)